MSYPIDPARTINNTAKRAHEINVANGWWEANRNTGELLMLIVTEVAEAMEDWREDKMQITVAEDGKVNGFPSEIADVIIRCFDLAHSMDIDLEDVISRKLDYNATRTHRHGGKRA